MEWKQWQSLSFKERHKLPAISGIYVVVDCDDNVWYVGQAVNLNIRWRGEGHHRYAQLIRSHGKRQFQIYWIGCLPEELNQQEQHYINLFQPSINRTKVKQYSLGKPQLKIEVDPRLSNNTYVYFRGKPECYSDIAEYVGIFPCTKDDEKYVAVEQSQLFRLGLAFELSLSYEVNGKIKTTKILCSLHKRSTFNSHNLRGVPYRGGTIVKIWQARRARYVT